LLEQADHMSESGWQRRFEDPILLPDERSLQTFRDAVDYITGLPKEKSDLPQWQVAIEALTLRSRGSVLPLGSALPPKTDKRPPSF